MPASRGVRSPLRLLHTVQAVTQFSYEVGPPRLAGIICSTVRSWRLPQYAHACLSRANRACRLNRSRLCMGGIELYPGMRIAWGIGNA